MEKEKELQMRRDDDAILKNYQAQEYKRRKN